MPAIDTPAPAKSPTDNVLVDVQPITFAKGGGNNQPPEDNCITDAFTLGWKIVELRSRIQIGLTKINEQNLEFASIWRALFNRISVLQVKAFPSSSTTGTLYDPPPKESLPYLYPPEPDYANIGIPGKRNDDLEILKDFKLYEVTRRGINCLTILYVDAEKCLVPDMVKGFQLKLVKQIIDAAKDPGAGGGEPQSDTADEQQVQSISTVSADEDFVKKNIATAREILTERILKFLAAWDGFLKENYYIGGKIPNNDAELIAFEAGRSLNWLSWGITVKTTDLDRTYAQSTQTNSTPEIPAQTDDQSPDQSKVTAYVNIWGDVFNQRSIIHLQHQISALSATLDDHYYNVLHPELKGQANNPEATAEDMNLPCHAIRAIKNSIEYWYRTVSWLSKHENLKKLRGTSPDTLEWHRAMRLSLIQQADIWQTLMTGQQTLKAFNMECVTQKIMQDVTAKMQKAMQNNFKQSIEQAKDNMKEVSEEVKGAVSLASQTALGGLNAVFQSSRHIIWPIIGVVVLIFFLLFILSFMTKLDPATVGTSGGITGFITVLLGYFGLKNVNTVKQAQATTVENTQTVVTQKIDDGTNKTIAASNNTGKSNFLHQIEGAAQDTVQMIWDAFKRGYEQIRKELADINRSAAVAYPLVEFFTLNFTLIGDEDFLTQIIWSSKERNDEISRVIGAALGPLAAFIPLPISTDENEEPKDILLETDTKNS